MVDGTEVLAAAGAALRAGERSSALRRLVRTSQAMPSSPTPAGAVDEELQEVLWRSLQVGGGLGQHDTHGVVEDAEEEREADAERRELVEVLRRSREEACQAQTSAALAVDDAEEDPVLAEVLRLSLQEVSQPPTHIRAPVPAPVQELAPAPARALAARRAVNPHELARRAAAERLWNDAQARKLREAEETSLREAGGMPAPSARAQAAACALPRARRPTMQDRGPAVIHTLPPASSRRSA